MGYNKNNKEGYYSSLTGFRRAVPIILAALAVFITVCLITDGTGIAGMGISSVLVGLFSYGAYAIPLVIVLHAVFYAEDVAKQRILSRVIFSVITVIVVSCVEYTIGFWGEEAVFSPVEFYKDASHGGFIGSVIAFAIVKVLGPVGLIIVAAATLAVYIAFFFADRDGAFGRAVLTALGVVAGALAAVERAIKKLIGKARQAKDNKEKREAEKKSAELLDDPFFAVDNGMKELRINDLGILESRSNSTLEENPTLQSSVFHKSALSEDEPVAQKREENEQAAPARKRTVDLSYGIGGAQLYENVRSENKKKDIIYDSPIFDSEKPAATAKRRESFGIDESAEAVFTSDFDPFDFSQAEKTASRASTKASAGGSRGIAQVEAAISLPSAEEVARQKRLLDFERRKKEILERSKAPTAGNNAPQTAASVTGAAPTQTAFAASEGAADKQSPVTPANTAPAADIAAQAKPTNTASTVGDESAADLVYETAGTAKEGAGEAVISNTPESDYVSNNAVYETASTREAVKTVEFNVTNEPKRMNEAPVEGATVKRTYEKPDYRAANADEAAVLIAEAVAMKNPAYARSANELRSYTQVVDDGLSAVKQATAEHSDVPQAPAAAEDATAGAATEDRAEEIYYSDKNTNDVGVGDGVISEYRTAEFVSRPEPSFKEYTSPAEELASRAEAEKTAESDREAAPTLKMERTMLSPTPEAVINDTYASPMSRRDERYTVIGEDMSLATEDAEVEIEEDDSAIWSESEASLTSGTEAVSGVSVSDEGTVFNFGDEPEEDEADSFVEKDDSEEIFGALSYDEENEAEPEEIPPAEQNPEVLRQREMFPFLDREQSFDSEENAIADIDGEELAEEDYEVEEDEPPFEEAVVVTPAPAATPKAAPVKEEKPAPVKPDYSNYEFPSIELLGLDREISDDNVQYEIQENADRLIDTLSSFNVTASIKGVDRGPRITRYEVVPAKGVKVSSIMNLQDDIALSLAADGIRMEAPIPGKSAVGVEIPNKKASTVRLRELLETEDFRSMKSKTAICIGKDVAGQPVINDISKMPHLLIAGATGMGKSVCINSLLISILYKARPDEVKLIMIDPKQVEFTMYNGIPHLLIPVVSDAKQAAGALMWAVEEMERRYNLLNPLCVRNVDAYNEKVTADPSLGEPMSKIIIVIDEFADLMLQVKDPVENLVMRIAQKARAAGIHLIVGTQRPSTNVITGTIKANIPSRISCKVASNVDSRTVLDAVGAEKLLNKGDMLFSYAGAIKPLRVQGAFVADSEVESIMAHLKQFSNGASYDEAVMEEIKRAADKCSKKGSGGAADYDDGESEGSGEGYLNDRQFLDAVDVAINARKISTSLLQRKLSIGYGKAAKFIDVMCDMGIIGEPNGQKPRDVLISADEWHEKLARTMID